MHAQSCVCVCVCHCEWQSGQCDSALWADARRGPWWSLNEWLRVLRSSCGFGRMAWSLLTQNPSEPFSRTPNHDLGRVQRRVVAGLWGFTGSLTCLCHLMQLHRQLQNIVFPPRRTCLLPVWRQARLTTRENCCFPGCLLMLLWNNLNGWDNVSYLFVSFFNLAPTMIKFAFMTRLNLKVDTATLWIPPVFHFHTKTDEEEGDLS